MKAYTGDQPFIFVSYAHADKDIVFPIIELLQDNGYRVWYDEGLKIGNDWRDELAERIRCCHAFIFMQSKQSVKSEYCKNEIYAADSRKKKQASESGSDDDSIPFLIIKLEESDACGGLKMTIDPKQKLIGINASAEDVIQQLINSKQLEECREQFRYEEGVSWGPVRKGYYFNDCPDHAVFNSVIDNPIYGDERHFLSINDYSQTPCDHLLSVHPGNTYTAKIYYCNDAIPDSNIFLGTGIALKTKVSVKLPPKLVANKVEILQATISTTTGEHKDTWDQYALYCSEDAVITLVGRIIHYNNGKLNCSGIGTQLFTEGAYIGFNKMNGVVPGGLIYSGSIEFTFRVSPIRKVTFERTVSVDRKFFSDHVSVHPGDILTFRIKMVNNHFDDVIDVTFRDELPQGLELISGSTVLYAVKGEGRKLSDHIVSNGINTGVFGTGVTGIIQYEAKVREDISASCELVSKSILKFNPIEQNSYNYIGTIVNPTITMHSETTCFVQV